MILDAIILTIVLFYITVKMIVDRIKRFKTKPRTIRIVKKSNDHKTYYCVEVDFFFSKWYLNNDVELSRTPHLFGDIERAMFVKKQYEIKRLFVG